MKVSMQTSIRHALCLALALVATPALADKAVFAGGCFWCVEADFEKLDGVRSAVSGFTGGTLANPTYEGRHDGHYEAVEIDYDPKIVSYAQLLDYYWHHIDPFDADGQFCDKGPTYRSAIFVANAQERALAEASKRAVQKRFPDQEVATEILDATTFWPIRGEESYHQDYYKNSAARYQFYRWSCGRDQRVEAIWGKPEGH